MDELFPVIKKLNWSERGWENWTWYYMGMGGGAVFVHKFILKKYKEYAEIDDQYIEYDPDYNAAENALKQFKFERAKRFTWGAEDLVFYSSKEDCEKAAAKDGRKVIWYD